MSSPYTVTRAPVFVVQDPRLTDPDTCLWAAQSNYTQADPAPTATATSARLTVDALGTVEAPGEAIEVQILRGGQPGRGAKAATLAWSRDGGPWHGHDLPATVAGLSRVETSPGATSTYQHPTICGLPSGAVLLAYTVAEVGGDTGIAVRRLPAGSTTWTARALVHDAAAGIEAQRPILVLAGPRVLLLAWVLSADAQTWHIRTWASEDDGETWAILGEYATAETDITTAGAIRPRRIAAAYHLGQIVLLAHLYRPSATYHDTLRQWASGDGGATFSAVYTQQGATTADSGGYPSAVTVDGALLLMWAQASGASVGAYQRARLGSAFQSIAGADLIAGDAWDAQAIEVSGGAITDADMALHVDDAGLLWLHWRYASSGTTSRHRCGVAVSGDGGRTTERVGVDPTDPTDTDQSTTWWASAAPGSSSAAYPTSLAATYARGRCLLAATHAAATSTADLSITVWSLGGWSTLTHPPTASGARLGDRGSWWHTWAPLERPDDLSGTYTTSTSGSSAASLSSGALVLTTGSTGGARYYTEAAWETDPTAGAIEAALTVTAGGSLLSAAVAVRLRVSDGSTYGATVEARLTADGIRLYDVVGGAALGTVSGLTAGPRAIRIALYCDGATASARLYYRDHNALAEARAWTAGPTGTPTDDGGAGGGSSATWGCIASSSSADTSWHHVAWSVGDTSTGAQPVGVGAARWDAWDPTTAPTGLQGATLSTAGRYLCAGLSLRGRTGPAAVGDTATIGTVYGYPVERLWSARSRSPRAPWRSVDTAEQQIALRVTTAPSTLAAGLPLSGFYGLILRGCNWRTGRLQRWTGSAWADVVTIDLAGPLGSLTYTRAGDTVRAATSAATAGYLTQGELVGCTWAAGSTRRRILAQSEGAWEGSATWSGPRAVLALDGATAADPSSGTAAVWRRDVAVLFAAQSAGGWRLIIDAQDTVDGYLQIGSMLLGPAWPAACPADWATVDELSQGRRRRTRDDGSAVVYGAAPPAREVALAWTDGVDESQALDGSAPAYLSWGSTPISARAAWARRLRSLVSEHDGEQVALILSADDGASTITRRADLLVGTLTSAHRLEAALGDLSRSQVVRLAALTVTEDP